MSFGIVDTLILWQRRGNISLNIGLTNLQRAISEVPLVPRSHQTVSSQGHVCMYVLQRIAQIGDC